MLSSNEEITPDFERLPEELKKDFKQVKKQLDTFAKKIREKNDILGISFFYSKEKTIVFIVSENDVKASHKKFEIKVVSLDELWKGCLENSETADMISRSTSIYDKGVLRAAKLSYLHKNMVLEKFEKYIVSYVLDGSVVKGKSKETSDIDVWIVIDDTDVKKMSRNELKDKLRTMILSMGLQIEAITGTKNKLHIQTWLLTDFWEGLRDAAPVYVTSLKQCVPFHDRGGFQTWKNMLKKGYIKPGFEAIDKQMEAGEQILRNSKNKVKEAVLDIYFAVMSAGQALCMEYYVPRHEEVVEILQDLMVKKLKKLDQKWIKVLKNVVKTKTKIEDKVPSMQQLEKMIKDAEGFIKAVNKALKRKIPNTKKK
ncbi:MAG: nucleotidyltransferase domain-containing protein [Nanoarchaeota archaeon]|nr:nucleotidyltransferase domain-containing protein [Nanoarchaeota archaeon]